MKLFDEIWTWAFNNEDYNNDGGDGDDGGGDNNDDDDDDGENSDDVKRHKRFFLSLSKVCSLSNVFSFIDDETVKFIS